MMIVNKLLFVFLNCAWVTIMLLFVVLFFLNREVLTKYDFLICQCGVKSMAIIRISLSRETIATLVGFVVVSCVQVYLAYRLLFR